MKHGRIRRRRQVHVIHNGRPNRTGRRGKASRLFRRAVAIAGKALQGYLHDAMAKPWLTDTPPTLQWIDCEIGFVNPETP